MQQRDTALSGPMGRNVEVYGGWHEFGMGLRNAERGLRGGVVWRGFVVFVVEREENGGDGLVAQW